MKPTPAAGNWTADKVKRFWEYHGTRTDLHSEYFSFQVGAGLTHFLRQTGHLRQGASVLDYGCGPGFLLQNLLEEKVRCYGADASREAVDLANRKFVDNENWMGASVFSFPPLPYQDRIFDIVTCLETLEHLDDDTLKIVLREVKRLLKSDGVALFTTPNEEELTHSYILCPFCNTEYHKVQHVRSFSAAVLRAVLEAEGFEVLFCRGVDLLKFQPALPGWRDWSYGNLKHWLTHRWQDLMDRFSPRPFPFGRVFRAQAGEGGPNLCAVVRQPE
ncbi:MAG: hypothetical protein QOF62_2844 [Pyrinomonadaceae bacterium]|jgi:2-polyprenyl-3-methyl-5-hydroxy-6-metoxy-1,4-benzoquinol methylase|nr:hypothetical protein [Pyrinomonadaceae bacterium]